MNAAERSTQGDRLSEDDADVVPSPLPLRARVAIEKARSTPGSHYVTLSLRNMKLTNTMLAAVPWHQLSHVRVLDLSNNRLTHLPNALSALRKLEELSAYKNEIRNIAPALFRSWSRTLRVLSLSDNRLEHLPGTIGRCKRLVSVDIASNQFRNVPPQLSLLEELGSVVVQNNVLCAKEKALLEEGGIAALMEHLLPLATCLEDGEFLWLLRSEMGERLSDATLQLPDGSEEHVHRCIVDRDAGLSDILNFHINVCGSSDAWRKIVTFLYCGAIRVSTHDLYEISYIVADYPQLCIAKPVHTVFEENSKEELEKQDYVVLSDGEALGLHLQKLLTTANTSASADFDLIVSDDDGKPVHAKVHAPILATRVNLLRSMLSSDMWMERRTRECRLPHIRLEALQTVLEWAYTGKIGFEYEADVIGATEFATMYCCERLQQEMELEIVELLTQQCVSTLFAWSNAWQLHLVRSEALSMLQACHYQLQQDKDYNALPNSLRREIQCP